MEDVFNNGYSIQYIQKATLDDQMSRYMVLGARCFDIPDEPFKIILELAFLIFMVKKYDCWNHKV